MIACWFFCIWRLLRLSIYRGAFEATLLFRVIILSTSCPLSKIALIVGVGYWFGPVDLIPNHIPYFGYLDQISFVLAGLIGARSLVPAPRTASLRASRPPPVIVKPVTIVFCHCPKTAGTSLFRCLSDRLGYRTSYLMRRQRPDLAHLQDRGFAFISGHAPYDHYCEMGAVSSRTRFIAFFREPRAVLLSHFAHVLRHRKSIPAARLLFEVELPGLGLPTTSPEAVRLFLQRHRDFDGCDADNPQTRFAANCPYGPLNESHLEQAKATFVAMDVVGCTERFEESLMMLAQRFGWSELSYHRLNVSHAGEKAIQDAALQVELDRHLAFDQQLVTWAAQRFEQSCVAMREGFPDNSNPLPRITLLEQTPPFRRWRHRVSAATTMLLDDWVWWMGATWAKARRRVTDGPNGQGFTAERLSQR